MSQQLTGFKPAKFCMLLLLSLILAACGGGSSTSTSTPTPTPTPVPAPTPTAAECPFGDYKSKVVGAINSVRSSPKVCNGVTYPAAGYNYASAGENIAGGQTSVNEVFFKPSGEGRIICTLASSYSKTPQSQSLHCCAARLPRNGCAQVSNAWAGCCWRLR